MTYVKLVTSTPQAPHPMDKLLEYLFTDKRSVYIDDIITNADGSFEVSWCRDHTLYLGDPQWIDTHINRDKLMGFIRQEKLNYWESFRYDHHTGSVQPFTNVCTDLDVFLDENSCEVIAEYLCALIPGSNNVKAPDNMLTANDNKLKAKPVITKPIIQQL